jgi:uncharacterized membrane protein HdeD (DUF308 family)|tara:strand:- start:3702 stop:4334 length:633 start_codon:yes stop_codon:yes gene_type:complete
MKDLVYSTVMPIAQKWWINLLMGLLFVSLGVWVFIAPLASYVSLTIFFSLALATAGAFEILASIFYRKGSRNWGWYMSGGILDLLIGGYLIFNPLITMTVLPYILAFWLLFRGLVALGVSLQLRTYEIKGWGWMLLYGAGILSFSVLIMFYPVIGGLSIVFATALAFLVLGLFNISAAYHLNRARKRIRKIQDHRENYELKGYSNAKFFI